MRAPPRLLATALITLAMAGCQGDPVSESSTEVRLAPRLVATGPVPAVHRIRVALLLDGALRDTFDLPYASGQELSLGSVPSGTSFEVVLVGYDLGPGILSARWGALARGTANVPGVQDVPFDLQVPERPIVGFSGTTTLDSLTSSDSLWAADFSRSNHPARSAAGARYRLGTGTPVPVSGALVFARTEPADFLPTSLSTSWAAFATVWSDTVLLTFSDPTNSVVPGSFVDARDGRTYTTTTWLGTTWMAQNLAWAGPTDSLGLCPGNDTAACTRLGRLYTWPQAMAGSTPSSAYPGTARGICPEGWHLPSPAEWDSLGANFGGRLFSADSLRSDSAWPTRPAARDAIGFSALAAGQGYADDSTFAGLGTDAWWWTSQRTSSSEAVRYGMSGSNAQLTSSNGYTSGPFAQMFSIRCVKDRP